MELGDILTKEQILTDLRASNRWEAIDELINNLVSTGKIKSEHHDAISAVVKKRESSMSTGIGFGIGIPHASTDLIYEVVGSLGRSKKGVNFDALDNQPVNLVMLFLVWLTVTYPALAWRSQAFGSNSAGVRQDRQQLGSVE